MKLTKERDLAELWEMPIAQFRLLRNRHQWAHVRFSRQDVRYTDEQVEQIVHDMTTRKPAKAAPVLDGLTSGSRART